MTIDAKELREAIAEFSRYVEKPGYGISVDKYRPGLAVLLQAASAYAATLPREIDVEDWAIVNRNGKIVESGLLSEVVANRQLERSYPLGHQVVRLSGRVVIQGGKD